MTTHVFHDESSVTFHPKLYLFSNARQARLFVGSNNLTESGLYTNTEGTLRFDGRLTSQAIKEAQSALARWRAQPSNLIQRLDHAFLNELAVNGYVRSEAELRRLRATARRSFGGARRRRRLFGTGHHVAPPAARTGSSMPQAISPSAAGAVGQVLLMRVRASRGGVQVQLPKALRSSPFIGAASSLRSVHNGQPHAIGAAIARGNVNTYKFDAPEVRGMTEPLLRLHWTNGELFYEAFDATTPAGTLIKAQLEAGFRTVPPQTLSSKPDRAIATWWRMI